jgi:uncharacterized membrane protein
MYRAFFVVMIPVLLVALGYVLMFRHLGFSPGYGRLFLAMGIFFGLIWLGRRAMRNSKPGTQ